MQAGSAVAIMLWKQTRERFMTTNYPHSQALSRGKESWGGGGGGGGGSNWLRCVEIWDTFLQANRTAHLVDRRSRKWRHTTSELVPQTNHSEQQAQTSGPLAHLSSAFLQPLRGSLSLNIVYTSCVTCSCGFVLQSYWYCQKSGGICPWFAPPPPPPPPPPNVARLSFPFGERAWEWCYVQIASLLHAFLHGCGINILLSTTFNPLSPIDACRRHLDPMHL